MPTWIPDVGAIASIVGALISGYVLWRVWGIEKRFLLRARLPELSETLGENASELSTRLQHFQDYKPEIEKVIADCEATLGNLRGKVKDVERKFVKRAQKLIRRKARRGLDRDITWEIYIALSTVIQSLKHFEKDLKWRD